MYLKKLVLFSVVLLTSVSLFAVEPTPSYKLYGFVRSDFYINSRQNAEGLDGLFNLFPKPVQLSNGTDINATASSEMLAVASRFGFDFNGTSVFGAKTSAKIECDFAGTNAIYYVIRLRQAYLKFNWEKSELLVGQTWHPMFSNLFPITPALSVGAPFQAFNRSPQIKLKQTLSNNLSALVSASYQMQYLSQGPVGSSSSYMKTGLLPSLFVGLDFKSKNVLAGIGVDGKSLSINNARLNSAAAVAYAAYTNKKFQIRVKSVLGQNLSEYIMIGGYGVSATDATSGKASYTNFNTSTSWISLAYGSKVQVGIYGGLSKNLGTNKDLLASSTDKFTAYGYGYYQDSQQIIDNLYRIAPHITYNIANISLGLEYEFTNATYGTIQSNGRVNSAYDVNNHRAMATISYLF